MAKSKLSCVATFLVMLAAPLQSALINIPAAERYKPRLTHFPEGSHLFLRNAAQTGFSPNVGKKSSDAKTSLTHVAFQWEYPDRFELLDPNCPVLHIPPHL
ncbi:hypothetical protein [Okeania sp. KiyG1]|uniref:hypothetical protein n=1 Tax=Okeania sp. KiyG1 TaxID=2720165 RepID=UPI001922FE7B|nr:hypothetical protein [Okeania sp. KiyG1]